MDRKFAAALVGGIVLVALALLLFRGKDERPPSPVAEGPIETIELVEPGEGVPATLYYPDEEGQLSGEEREVAEWATPLSGATVLLRALLSGPTDESLVSPLPEGVTLGELFLTPTGQLYVDLVSTELDRPPRTGSQAELLAVYSLVDTVLLNVPEIGAMVLMWNGRQLDTFAGHVDTSLPLQAEPDLIRTGQ